MDVDLPGTISALADIGYKRVETAGFHGRTAAQFKAILDANGIYASSNHIGIPQPFNENTWGAMLDDVVTLGSKYVVHPFFGYGANGGERKAKVWQDFAMDLNRAGEMARKRGVSLGYHNHHFEFQTLSGHPERTVYDVFTDTIDPKFVHLEMDLFWVTRGGHDPVDEIARLSKTNRRVLQFHVKDMSATFDAKIPFEDPGYGIIDFRRIFKYNMGRTQEYIVERDDAGTTPRKKSDALVTAANGFNYLRDVTF